MQPATGGKPRIEVIDMARGIALLAMAVYHLGWDFEFFGYMEPGTTVSGGWRLFARSIAASFLFLVGVSLFLAQAETLRWRPFGKRLAMIAAAAAAITLATWFATPQSFIYFGILHHIAVASLLGLAFLHLPAWLVAVAAVGAVAAPHFLRAPFFDQPALWWVGLSTDNPHSNDYVPLFPWFGAVLAGIAAARLARRSGLTHRLALMRPRWRRPFTFLGRHGLAFYLVHQPVLIGCVWLLTQVWPAPAATPRAQFSNACSAQCAQTRAEAFCTAYCGCVVREADAEGLLEPGARAGPAPERRLSEIARQCTMATEQGTNRER